MTVSEEDLPRSPAVASIYRSLEQRIRSGEYAGGGWLPTERALASEFSVSRATVRAALSALQSSQLLERSTACRPRVIFNDPFVAAPSKRKNIAVWVITQPGDAGAYATLQGIRRAVPRDNLNLVLDSPDQSSRESAISSEAEFLDRAAADADTQGVLLWYLGGRKNLPALRRVREAGVSLVFVDRQPPEGFEADCVCIDNVEAARAAVGHLISLGHRRIAHITNVDTAGTVADRRLGYTMALAAAGLEVDPALIVNGDFMEAAASDEVRVRSEMAEKLLGLNDPPTAIFAVNDHTAQSAIYEFGERGMRLPEDMSVVGFDDVVRWTHAAPRLTTVRQPFERMGQEAAELLLSRMGGIPPTSYRQIVLETELIVRYSTQGPKGAAS